jgi:hypothetical protein
VESTKGSVEHRAYILFRPKMEVLRKHYVGNIPEA